MAYKSITKRWLFNSFGIIVIVVLLIDIAVLFAVRNYYYSYTNSFLKSAVNGAETLMQQYYNDSNVNLNTKLRSMVEEFSYKDRIEMMLIDFNGDIVMTSSGFETTNLNPDEEQMPDYEKALSSADGTGSYVGKMSVTGEKIMAISVVCPDVTSDYSAIRYVVSLKKVDNTVMLLMLVINLAFLAVIVLIFISNFYFIKSIVIPIRKIGNTARKFAAGDMSERINKHSNDEVGELGDILNYMADEIQNTEKMKNEFISSVSHELRTPLTAIKGWSETLMTTNPEETQMITKGMRVINNETQRLADMVEDLLDFSRMQSGGFKFTMAKMDVLAELGDAVLMYTEKARRENIKLIYNEPQSLPFIFGDKNRIKQVFINVIDNALKYTESGGTITVSALEDGERIKVTVKDTGCGISKEDLPKVKQKFYKANHTKHGSGIGLAVVNEIITMHEGELLIDSKLSKGTTVTVVLPSNAKNHG